MSVTYNWLPAERTIPDLEAILEHAILNAERSLQTTIGPSSLGAECDRCLVLEMGGRKPAEQTAPWLPTIGTAVHAWAEEAMIRHLARTGSDRYIPEGRVMVGVVDGTEIWGSSDLFDIHTGTVVDYKVVGTTTLRATRKAGAKLTYRRQAHLYGKGWEDKGYDVRSVAIWMLPRNGFTIGAGYLHQEPYDRALAEATIAHADMLAAAIRTLGLEAVLAAVPTHTGTEFACPSPEKATPTAEAFLGA